jgi:hypothetical protein
MRKIAIGLAAAALATGLPAFGANASYAVSGSEPVIRGGDEARVELAHYYGRGYYGRGYYGRGYYGRGYYGRGYYGRGYYGRGYYGRGYYRRYYR